MVRKTFGRKHEGGWHLHEETVTEATLGDLLRKRGWRVQQEAAIGPFHVDFLVEGAVVVEVDGSSHLIAGRRQQDARRDQTLRASGYVVIRIPSEAVARGQSQSYLNQIAASLKRKRSAPQRMHGDHRQRWEQVRRRVNPRPKAKPQPSMEEVMREDADLLQKWLDQNPVVDKDASPERRRRR